MGIAFCLIRWAKLAICPDLIGWWWELDECSRFIAEICTWMICTYREAHMAEIVLQQRSSMYCCYCYCCCCFREKRRGTRERGREDSKGGSTDNSSIKKRLSAKKLEARTCLSNSQHSSLETFLCISIVVQIFCSLYKKKTFKYNLAPNRS